MDASAFLKKQGWRGLGHTLHPTDDSTGLARPLLLSRKDDKQGLGSESIHRQAAATDQWWLDAFDQQLKSVGTPGASTNGTATPTGTGARKPTRLEMLGGNKGYSKYRGAYGLYASFVRGGMIEGTVDTDTDTDATATSSASATEASTAKTTPEREDTTIRSANWMKKEKKEKKRKRSDDDDDTTKQEKKDKKRRKDGGSSSKDERRAQKDEAKRIKKEEKKAKRREEKAAEKAVKKAEKKAAKKEARAAEKLKEKEAKKAAKKEEKASQKAAEKAAKKAPKASS